MLRVKEKKNIEEKLCVLCKNNTREFFEQEKVFLCSQCAVTATLSDLKKSNSSHGSQKENLYSTKAWFKAAFIWGIFLGIFGAGGGLFVYIGGLLSTKNYSFSFFTNILFQNIIPWTSYGILIGSIIGLIIMTKSWIEDRNE